MKSVKIFLVMLLVGTITSGIYARPVEVYLLPSSPGEPSKMISPDKPSGEWLIQYDGGEGIWYLIGLFPGDTLGVFFTPPAACSLVEVHFCKKRWGDESGPTQYYGIAAYVPGGVTLDDYDEYHSDASMPGPSCIGTILAGPTALDINAFDEFEWDTLDVPGNPDIGTNNFWAGTTIEDTTHSTRIDATVDPPHRAICYKQGGTGPETNGPGWYSSWHLFWVRALVRVYENIPPIVDADALLGTYDTSDRTVYIYTEDFGPVAPGIDEIYLYYYLEGKTDTLAAIMVQDSVLTEGSFEYAWWHADIPGQSAGSVVHYWVECTDNEGADGSSGEFSYGVGAGTSGYGLLYVESDDVYGDVGVHDAFGAFLWDVWYESTNGVADNTVTDFYISGAGVKAVSWLSFSSYSFANWSFTQAFSDFMDNGGCVFISSEDVVGSGYGLGYGGWSAPSPHPLRDYLKAYTGTDDYITTSPFTLYVENTDFLTAGMQDELTVDCDSIGPGTWVGIFTDIDANCVPLFYDGEGNILGYRYESSKGFKVVFLYFPFHGITSTDDQDEFISNITGWFGVGADITVSPDSLYIITPIIVTDSFWIGNLGSVSLSVDSITHAATWITDISPTNFTVDSGDSTPVYITMDPDSFVLGVFVGKDTLWIWSNDPDENPYAEPVKLATPSCTLIVVNTRGAPGSTDKAMDIELNNSMGISGVQFTLIFDDSLLTANSAILTPRTSHMSIGHTIWSDSVLILLYSMTGDSILPGNGPIVDVIFDVDSSAIPGDSLYVNISHPVLSDPEAKPIFCDTINGWFLFGSEKGDLNDDGEININDVVRCANIILCKPPPPTLNELWAADVNSDGAVNVIDCVIIVNIILGKKFTYVMRNIGEPVLVNITELPGSQADLINITIDITNTIPVAGLQLTLKYDPDIFTPSNPQTTERSKGFELASNSNSGELTILVYNLSGMTIESGTGAVINIPLNITSPCDATLELKDVILAAEDASPIPTEIQNGSLTMNPIPKIYGLSQNYPNPFGDKTEIRYQLPENSKVNLSIYNCAGQLVRELVNEEQKAGYYVARWDSRDNNGKRVVSGIYFYRIMAEKKDNKYTTTKKLILIR